jgi:acyl-coenzyme A thioesterase PaaI-like protein
MKKSILLRFMSFWPPYLGAGIRVKKISSDMTLIEVEMKLRFWNQNYVGTQFGGSLYSMVDPFFMLILVENLGSNYIVWDKAATIRFINPGRGRVRAKFEITKPEIEKIRARVDAETKLEPKFLVQILNDSNEVIAEVEKTLYVRRKDKINATNTRQLNQL